MLIENSETKIVPIKSTFMRRMRCSLGHHEQAVVSKDKVNFKTVCRVCSFKRTWHWTERWEGYQDLSECR